MVPSSFKFTNFSDVSGFNLQGNAASAVNSSGASVLRLTPAVGGQVGSAWYNVQKPLVAGNFTTTFQFELSNGSGGSNGGSDGFSFGIQNSNPTFLGGGGGSLGYDGLRNSVVVEFDTFQNSQLGDTSNSEIAVHTNGTGPNSVNESYSLGNYDTPTNLGGDGKVHTVQISYTPGTLSIYLDSLTAPVLKVSINLASTLNLDADRAWLGFTGATGGGWQNQDILNWSFQGDDNLVQANSPSVIEGAAGTTTPVNFTISRVGSTSGPVTVNWSLGRTATCTSRRIAGAASIATMPPLVCRCLRPPKPGLSSFPREMAV
jgi:hypothetical protein